MVPGSTKLSCPAGRGDTEIWHLELLKDGDTDLRVTSIQAGSEQRWMGSPRTGVE